MNASSTKLRPAGLADGRPLRLAPPPPVFAGRTTLGNQAALEAIYRAFQPQLLKFIVRRYPALGADAAEDVVSEVFLRIRQRGRIPHITRAIQNYLKRLAGQVAASRLWDNALGTVRFPAGVPSRASSPDAAMDRKELAQRLAKAMASLAQPHRMVLQLSLLGLSIEQMACHIGCTEETAQRRLNRVRQQLQLTLSRCGASCVMGTRRQNSCPARESDSYCLKSLYMRGK